MKKICVLFAIVVLLAACVYHNDAPAVVDGEVAEALKMDSIIADTATLLNVQNVHVVDSARQILVHEIYVLRDKGHQLDDYSIESKKSRGFNDSHIINLIFENLTSNKKYLLTNDRIRISSYSELWDKAGNRYLLFRVADRDYNQDGKLSMGDIESLYISNIDGTSFTKLTKDRENLEQGKWIGLLQRYYFHTLEDSNKDGYFNTIDRKHYYYIEFKDGKYKTIEYNPLENLYEE